MYAIIDIEATGGSPKHDKVMDIAIYLHNGQQIVDSYTTLINPEVKIPPFVSKLTGITDNMVSSAPKFQEVARQIIDMTKDAIFVAHNVQFDYLYIKNEFKRLGYSFLRPQLCTINLTRKLIPGLSSYGLDNLCKELDIPITNRHRAAGDAEATTHLFEMLVRLDKDDYIKKLLKDTNQYPTLPPNLPVSAVETLPEETGVYYLHGEAGKILYIGKSIDIRKRIFQHFSASDEPENKQHRMMRLLHDISYEETGSELIALLLESAEIKKYKPPYNRAQRSNTYRFGLYLTQNEQGYQRIEIKRRYKNDKPVTMFDREITALNVVRERTEKYQLCPAFCGNTSLKAKGECIAFQMNECRGACMGLEKPSEYNKRVEKALKDLRYPQPNFAIIGEGRSIGEQSVIIIKDNMLIGYGFFQETETIDFNTLLECLNPLPQTPDACKVINSYLQKNKQDKVLKL